MANEDSIHEFLGDDDYLLASLQLGPDARVCFEDVSRAVKLKHEALLEGEAPTALERLGAKTHDFLGFFAVAAPKTFHGCAGLCEQMGMSDEFEANPLALILANRPRCCTHIARCFLDCALDSATPARGLRCAGRAEQDIRRHERASGASSSMGKQASARPRETPPGAERPAASRLRRRCSRERSEDDEEEPCWKRAKQASKAPNEFEN